MLLDRALNILTICVWILLAFFILLYLLRTTLVSGFGTAVRRLFSTRMLYVLLAFAVALVFLNNSLVFIEPQDVGVVVSLTSPQGYRSRPFRSGLHWIIPFMEEVHHFPISLQTYTMSATPTEGATPSVEPATPGAAQPTSDEGAADEKAPSGGSPRPSAVAKARATQRSKAVAAETEEEPLEEVKVEGSTAEPNSPQALAAQGYVALHRQRYIQAIRFFRLALMSNPPNGTALFGLAEGYRASGQHTAALRTYRRYMDLMPNGPEAMQARAHIRALESKGR